RPPLAPELPGAGPARSPQPASPGRPAAALVRSRPGLPRDRLAGTRSLAARGTGGVDPGQPPPRPSHRLARLRSGRVAGSPRRLAPARARRRRIRGLDPLPRRDHRPRDVLGGQVPGPEAAPGLPRSLPARLQPGLQPGLRVLAALQLSLATAREPPRHADPRGRA